MRLLLLDTEKVLIYHRLERSLKWIPMKKKFIKLCAR